MPTPWQVLDTLIETSDILLVGRAVVQLVGCVGCVRKGRMAYAEGWELHGQVRVV